MEICLRKALSLVLFLRVTWFLLSNFSIVEIHVIRRPYAYCSSSRYRISCNER